MHACIPTSPAPLQLHLTRYSVQHIQCKLSQTIPSPMLSFFHLLTWLHFNTVMQQWLAIKLQWPISEEVGSNQLSNDVHVLAERSNNSCSVSDLGRLEQYYAVASWSTLQIHWESTAFKPNLLQHSSILASQGSFPTHPSEVVELQRFFRPDAVYLQKCTFPEY